MSCSGAMAFANLLIVSLCRLRPDVSGISSMLNAVCLVNHFSPSVKFLDDILFDAAFAHGITMN